MEQRQFARRPVNLEVTLLFNRHPVAHGCTFNIGPRGAFISTNSIVYMRNTEVELEFTQYIGTNKVQTCRVPAAIAHSSSKGMGLRFIESDATDYLMSHALLGMMCNNLGADHVSTMANG